MAKLPILHSYSDANSFDRLLLLIATLAQHPGIGSRTVSEVRSMAALDEIQMQMKAIATHLNLDIPNYSVHTLRKDLATLRQYEILDRNRHDWGYYLGTGVLNREELCLALHALTSLATHQGDPQAKRIQQKLIQRLRGLDADLQGKLFYPVRQHTNRATVETDPDILIRSRKGTATLFHELEIVEVAISQGQALELAFSGGFYGKKRTQLIRVYPLQLIYHDIAWYLLCEYQQDGHFAMHRINRLKSYYKILTPSGRGIEQQSKQLAIAHQLLQNGWGLFLGEPDQQKAELEEKLPLEAVKVRFFPAVMEFILEGDRRHPNQRIRIGPKDRQTGQPKYVDFSITLPQRSLKEFSLWVNRYMEHAQVLSPPHLVEQYCQASQALAGRYISQKAAIANRIKPL